jgi:protein-tyrosine phosphatase
VVIAFAERCVSLEVAHNVRHLGGYATRDGRRTRSDVIRAASLHRLADPGALVSLGVRTVVDLRSSKEREEMVTPDLASFGIRHEHAPVFEADGSPRAFTEGFAGYAPIYEQFLDTGLDAYRKLFFSLAGSEGAFVFHCAAGKDRTGVAAALMLDLAGVADGDIIADYALSAGLLEPALREWEAAEEQREDARRTDPELRRKLMASDPEDMDATLTYLRSRWGSAEGYLSGLGLDDADIARVRARLTI